MRWKIQILQVDCFENRCGTCTLMGSGRTRSKLSGPFRNTNHSVFSNHEDRSRPP